VSGKDMPQQSFSKAAPYANNCELMLDWSVRNLYG